MTSYSFPSMRLCWVIWQIPVADACPSTLMMVKWDFFDNVCVCVVDILFWVVSDSVHMLIGKCFVLELNTSGYTGLGFA